MQQEERQTDKNATYSLWINARQKRHTERTVYVTDSFSFTTLLTGEWKSAASWAQSHSLYICRLCFYPQLFSHKVRLKSHCFTHSLSNSAWISLSGVSVGAPASSENDRGLIVIEGGKHRRVWNILVLTPYEGASLSSPVNHESKNVTDVCLLWCVGNMTSRRWSLAGGRKQSLKSCTYIIEKVAYSKPTQAHLKTV